VNNNTFYSILVLLDEGIELRSPDCSAGARAFKVGGPNLKVGAVA